MGREQLIEAYLTAHERVVADGFAAEIDWQDGRQVSCISEQDFLRESAWVILSSGMRERVIRDRFPQISEAFLNWSSAHDITRHRARCSRNALRVFRHSAKIAAIAFVAQVVARHSFEVIRLELQRRGLELLASLPYIGPVTQFHLAKNLGMDVVKPDRHLVRLAHAAGFAHPAPMCSLIAETTGDRLATVDLVLWRYATIEPAYEKLFFAANSCLASRLCLHRPVRPKTHG